MWISAHKYNFCNRQVENLLLLNPILRSNLGIDNSIVNVISKMSIDALLMHTKRSEIIWRYFKSNTIIISEVIREGWEKRASCSTGQVYYLNQYTKQSQCSGTYPLPWLFPLKGAGQPPAGEARGQQEAQLLEGVEHHQEQGGGAGPEGKLSTRRQALRIWWGS